MGGDGFGSRALARRARPRRSTVETGILPATGRGTVDR